MNILKQLFRTALQKSNSKKAYERLDKGKKINIAPKSDRYTYSNQEDTQYDRDWIPATSEDRKTLSPEGYYRVGDRAEKKQELKDGIFNSALARAYRKAEAEGKEKSEAIAEARKEANDIFDKEYNEKQISIDSTAIANIDYDPKTEGLWVRFQGGNKKYFYPGVPLELVQAWVKSPSKGEFFMSKIHDQYTMNKGHKPVGLSTTYGDMNKKQVNQWFKKYTKKYNKSNKNNGWKKNISKKGKE